MPAPIDLSALPVADVHCHGLRAADVAAGDPERWDERLTLMGMCLTSSATADDAMRAQLTGMTDGTVLALVARRWLAEHLGCDPGDVAGVRAAALAADPAGYVAGLLSTERVEDLFVDDGYPRPVVPAAETAALTGARVHQVRRIELLIEAAQAQATTAADLEDAFRAQLEEAVADDAVVAFKTVIAYRTGLDVTAPDRRDVADAVPAWRDAGWVEDRAAAKTVRDHLLHVTCEVAATHDRAVHIHSGAGDPDVRLPHVRPAGLAPLLARHPATAIVLIHAGFPWVAEATYLAAIYPNAHLDLSLHLPWATLDADRIVRTALGLAPTGKVMYGSDEASEPEVLWLSARIGRQALGRVVGHAVATDLLTTAEAERIAAGVLAGNALRLHGLPG